MIPAELLLINRKIINVFLIISLSSCIPFPGSGEKENHTEIKKRFRSEVEQIIKDYHFPGMTAAFALPDGSVEVVAAGYSDLEHSIPMTNDSRMLAASIGKTFTSAVILDLVFDGKLHLDVPVQKYIGDKSGFLVFQTTAELRSVIF